MGIQCDTASAR
jgi:hypothetical protein